MPYRPDAIKEIPERVRSQDWEKKDAAREMRPREREMRLSGRAAGGGRFGGCGGEGMAVAVIDVDGIGTSSSCSSTNVVLPCVPIGVVVDSSLSALSGECCAG
jgi:hypothetical protein